MSAVSPTPTQSNQLPPGGGYDAMPPGTLPPQGYYPPPGYQAPPSGLPSAAWVDPATGVAAPYNPSPYGNGNAVAIPIAQAEINAPPANPDHEKTPAKSIETGRWTVGLCDCCSNCVPNLCMSCCCPCVSLAQVYARLALSRYPMILGRLTLLVVAGIVVKFVFPNKQPDYSANWDEDGNYDYTATAPDMLSTVGSFVYLLIQVVFALHVYHARHRIRERFQIPGSCCCDCVVSCCCSCCAIAQMATHVKSYKPGNCSFGAPDVLPPFK